MHITPPNTLFPAPVDDFVFSEGRRRRFQHCRRGFYFYYVSCRGGDSFEQPEEIQLLYRLKQLTPYQQWLDKLLYDAIVETNLNRPRSDQWIHQCESTLFRRLKRGIYELERELWREDPAGTLNLWEIYYRTIDQFSFVEFTMIELKKRMQLVAERWGRVFATLGPGAIPILETPLNFHYNHMHYFMGPALLWREGIQLHWVQWQLPAEPNDAWMRYYARHVLNIAPDKVMVEFYDCASGALHLCRPEDFNFTPVAQETLADGWAIRQWLRDVYLSGVAPETLSGPEEGQDACRRCRFQGYCNKYANS